jgi:hypothetical protein
VKGGEARGRGRQGGEGGEGEGGGEEGAGGEESLSDGAIDRLLDEMTRVGQERNGDDEELADLSCSQDCCLLSESVSVPAELESKLQSASVQV